MDDTDPYDWLDRLEERLGAPVPRPPEDAHSPAEGKVPERRDEISPGPAAPLGAAPPVPAGTDWWKGSHPPKVQDVPRDLVAKLERLTEEREQTLEELETLRIENASLKEKQQAVLSQLNDLRMKALAAIEGYEAKLRALEEQKRFFEGQVADQKQITDKLMDTVRTVKAKP